MSKINVKIGNLELKNPVMTASGTFGYGVEFADFVPLEEIGGIIVKGTTLHPRQGNDYPRMAETPQGMLNCVGLQNKGVDYFCRNIYPTIKDIDTQFIVNVSGSSPDDYAECARRIDALERINAIELNISCPNVKDGGMAFGVTCQGAAGVVKAVKIPVIGLGGISSAEDAIEFLMAGATAVEIGTANFIDPAITKKVKDGIAEWLDRHNIEDIHDIINVL